MAIKYDLFINNEWVTPETNEWISVENPATKETVGQAARGGEADLDRAVAAAKAAFPAWSRKTATERADYVHALKDLVKRDKEKLAETITSEMGKPLQEARVEVDFAIGLLRFAAENTLRLQGEIIPGSTPDEKILIDRVPLGVIGAITAWNFPLALCARKIGPAIAAGNTIVVKPHELTPLASLHLAKLVEEAEIPRGVVNIVTGDGPEVGVPLVAHPDVKLITMTGSTPAGKKIMAAAAETLKEVRLELGGKAPFLVMEDADLEKAAEAAVQSRFMNTGQVCTCNERTYIHEAVYDEFVQKVRQKIGALKVGLPTDPETDMGPKVSEDELKKVHEIVEKAVKQGAKLETGGKRLTGGVYDKGYFYAPTLLTDVSQDMDIVHNEVFGPVMSLIKVKDFDQALAWANDCRYGLSAYLFTKDLGRILRMTRELEFGEVYVNRPGGEAPQGFHHGYKESGLGGEDGQHGLEAYVQTKTVYLNA
ncbi:aldehyde dehydrogenase [Gluconobacter thailandicus F149-1 = NBRC 100600]|uniref:Aldehyde dehydrogenase n=1 Tax=Gluconobacter thailandicus NBRC 3257 TaxID=1381097 RepID=A0ABQ0IXZ5_GLUTH|nr:aldehyde dehydrogenase [Gluconobacter thailandicus]KXV51887.1 aldehyde dehydrogenase [Gluconobacter thailandicus]GAC87358.1 aldehyde dehydrogenase [Gluconobacter thailandicus NBRC 3255]GAD27038.1 aldehyde dehydrogenase [Gluconobacter thailandicus NBRC 3257]GAN93416.1 aldehyde dehydrogenase [Gluconobacter thailandicus F149-1 = NBRC 100600]GBR57946.1 aldehyde dehydrogenase [Gluconobacter thailandicus F149-1 = NBRC 100600]